MVNGLHDAIPAWVDGALRPVAKLAVHQRGLRHPAVSVFVLNRGRTLLQQRAAGKYHTPGLWANSCCTHPLWGEAPEACAIRRLHEELGITGLAVSFAEQTEYRADVGGGLTEHEVVDIFVAQAPDDLVVTPDPHEVQAIDWVDRPTLMTALAQQPARFTPWLKVYMHDHADQVFPA